LLLERASSRDSDQTENLLLGHKVLTNVNEKENLSAQISPGLVAHL
jgi:hypothetical protein